MTRSTENTVNTSAKSVIPPLALMLIGGAVAAAVFACLKLERLRKKGLQKAAIDEWEDEGGSVATTVATVASTDGAPH